MLGVIARVFTGQIGMAKNGGETGWPGKREVGDSFAA